MRFAEKGKMQPVENFHRFDKLKHCMVLPEAFYPTGSIEKYGSAFICIRKTLINRNLQFYAEKCNIEPQPSAGAVARWINRRLTRRVRAWERPNQITLINTDQRRHGGIRMANRAEKTNPLQASLRQVRFFSANPARGIIRAHPRYPWLGPLQLRSARGLLKNYPEVRLEISESGHGLLLSFLRVDLQPESQPESQPEFKLEQRVMALLQTQALGKKQISEVNQKY
jgi:hypothetical protein